MWAIKCQHTLKVQSGTVWKISCLLLIQDQITSVWTKKGQLYGHISADTKIHLASLALEPSSFVVFPHPRPIWQVILLVLSLYIPVSILFFSLPLFISVLSSDSSYLTHENLSLFPALTPLPRNHTSHISLSAYCLAGLFSGLVQMINPYHVLHGPFFLILISRHGQAPCIA